LRWIGRITLIVIIALLIVAMVLLIAGTMLLSSIVERGVGSIGRTHHYIPPLSPCGLMHW